MTKRYPLLYDVARFIAVFVVMCTFLFPNALAQSEFIIATALIMIVGIPHGATDHLLFTRLQSSFLGSSSLQQFYLKYLLLVAAYSILWWLAPIIALAIFLLLSIYHFGQSNWNYVSFTRRRQAWLAYLLWGSFVLLLPIVWRFEVAREIITKITSHEIPTLSLGWRQIICVFLLVLNVFLIFYLKFYKIITLHQVQDELLNLFVLGALFLFTPLLLSFAVYFAFWHSMSSVADQIKFFSAKVKNYHLKAYISDALPLSLVALGGLALLYFLQHQVGFQAHIGWLFIFISVVTLPHMILIDLLYNNWKTRDVASE